MNQANRRPMSAALQAGNELPPEAIALIREGTPRPRLSTQIVQAPAEVNQEAIGTTPDTGEATPASPSQGSQKPSRPKAARDKEPEPMPQKSLVSITFRVPAQLPAALLRVSADRKARRIRPFTQQEIMAEALEQWLKRNSES